MHAVPQMMQFDIHHSRTRSWSLLTDSRRYETSNGPLSHTRESSSVVDSYPCIKSNPIPKKYDWILARLIYLICIDPSSSQIHIALPCFLIACLVSACLIAHMSHGRLLSSTCVTPNRIKFVLEDKTLSSHSERSSERCNPKDIRE